jgi:hypothetical protein
VTRTVRRVVKLLLGLVMGIVVIEAALRYFPRSFMPKEFRILNRVYTGRVKWERMIVGDKRLGYHFKPQLDILFPSEGRQIPIRTTNYGLGDIGFRDIGARAPFNVVAVGDSFAFCDDVPAEKCWLRSLAERTGLSIASLGVSGYSTLAEARILDIYGKALKPHVVLVSVFPNDFNDNVDFDEWTRSNSENFWYWRARKEGRGPFGRWLADHSVIYRMIDGALRSKANKPYKYKSENLDFVFQPWWLTPPSGERAEERQRGWELMQSALSDMQATARSIGAELMVVLIPTKEHVYWDLVHDHLSAREPAQVDDPLDMVRAYCETRGIHYCVLKGALQDGARQGRQLYLRISSHWNDAGNAIGAETVARCLADQGLLDRANNGSPPHATVNGN